MYSALQLIRVFLHEGGQPGGEFAWVGHTSAFRNNGLLVQKGDQIAGFLLLAAAEEFVQFLDQLVVRVDLHDALGRRNLLVHGLHQPFHARTHPVFVGNQTGRTGEQPVGEADLLDILIEFFLDELFKGLVVLFLFFEFFLALLGIIGEVDLALGNRLQLLLFELGEMLGDDLVDRIGEEEYLEFFHGALRDRENSQAPHGILR